MHDKQGSSFVYMTYLHPFFLEHENDIDHAILDVKERARAAGMGYVRRLYAAAKELLLGELAGNQQVRRIHSPTRHALIAAV